MAEKKSRQLARIWKMRKFLWMLYLIALTVLIIDTHNNEGVAIAIYLLLFCLWVNTTILLIYFEDLLSQLKSTCQQKP